MSVRQSLLAILDQGPCYGYQLRAEFDRRTGATWPLNVGQIYNTLERLERDGLVVKDDVDEQGHVYWRITDAGRAEVRAWWAAPVGRAGARDELAIKLAIAATLPGVDAVAVVRAQESASRAGLDELRARRHFADGSQGPETPEGPETPRNSPVRSSSMRWSSRPRPKCAGSATSPSASPRGRVTRSPSSSRPRNRGAGVHVRRSLGS